MYDIKRKIVKIAGESGQGVNSIGELIAKALKRSGYYVFGYREYPSLIKGGYSNYQIDFSDISINSSSMYCHLAVCLSRTSIHEILNDIAPDGILIHCINRFNFTPEEEVIIRERNLKVVYIDAKDVVENKGGMKIMINTFLVGLIWSILNEDGEIIKQALIEEFSKKPKILDKNLEILFSGINFQLPEGIKKFETNLNKDESQKQSYLISGNQTLALGAIKCGVRAYYSYPMTPASSLLTYFTETFHQTGMLVKQAEDEITAAQMTLGSMHMGTRALVGTSGGGFDLMTESLSLAMITEIPFVCIIAQRPGPATGVPTGTSAADLNLAIHAGHGDGVRCVIAASDAISAFMIIQKAYNIAEQYQIPVLVMTEKQIAESLFNIKEFPESINIERGLVSESDLEKINSNDRFKLTDNGISPRWLPGQTDQTFNANSDEHFDNGRLTEKSEEIKLMMEKRMKKMSCLKNELSEPELFGQDQGDILFVGWGSAKNPVLDAVNGQMLNVTCSYLHYEYVYPIKTKKLMKIKQNFRRIILVEGNYTGQLGQQIKLECGYEFEEKLLKYDGRPFFLEDVLDFIENIN